MEGRDVALVTGGASGIGRATAVLLATVAALVLRLNAKPRVEAIASEALGMEVHVGGRLAIRFLPGLHVALADVHLRQRGAWNKTRSHV